jgi:hypothetical protein
MNGESEKTAPGRTWIFEPVTANGKGYWYPAGAGRFDNEGRAFGSVRKLPYGGGREVMICPPGVAPPGDRSPPSFPFLRYAAQIDREGDPLGLVWCFRHIHKSGRGHPDDVGISWFDDEGRARGKFLMRLTSHFKGIVIICPPGLAPPPGPYPPIILLPTKAGARADDDDSAEDEDTDE